MTPDTVMSLGREALWLVVLLAAPPLLAALAIGLFIGVLQAATQINEMTLSFIPKLLGLAGVLAAFGPWMLHNLIDFTRNLFNMIPGMLG